MTTLLNDEPTPRKPLRLWPGIAAVALQWLAWLAVPVIVPNAALLAVGGAMLGGLAVVVWWLFFSRAPWFERLGAVALMIAAPVATRPLLHVSIATGGMGFLFPVYVIPVLSLAFVIWAVATRRLAALVRRASMVAAMLLACGAFTLLRTGGITAGFQSDLRWRWAETPEERLLARAGDEPVALAASPEAAKAPEEGLSPQAGREAATLPSARPVERPADAPVAARAEGTPTATPAASVPSRTPAPSGGPVPSAAGVPPTAPSAPATARAVPNWPGFRGPERTDTVRGVRIATDWAASPPVELWRRPIGPGWSSFAVRGDLLYTQEQRGNDEVVACYRLSTGESVWRHGDAARFWESNAGAGPRATPTVSNGRVYTFGATGIVNALDARNGALVWSRNASTDIGMAVPGWGFASSPLVVGEVVVVAAGGQLIAYDLAGGVPRWRGPARGQSYSSPHLLTIDGVAQILLMSADGAIGVAPADGALLWEYKWPTSVGIVQPALAAGKDVLISAGETDGVRRLAVSRGVGGWIVEERWRSIRLKPYFNDFVLHKGHAFGFDGSILACLNLEDGQRAWKGGRYGNGQLVLLADQDLLLVVSEEGELVLVAATPDQFKELARFPALEGKTWNHPVLVGDLLLVRNDREMAAFRLVLAGR